MAKKSLESYINSCDFVVDYSLVRTGYDTCEWVYVRGITGQPLIWISGRLSNVSSVRRMEGTFDEFAAFIKKRLKGKFKKDYEYPHIEGIVLSLLGDMPVAKWGKKRAGLSL